MNWRSYEVSEIELERLEAHNEPIPVPRGVLESNAGVEVFALTGKRMNAIYDVSMAAIRKLNANNPQFSSMPNRDLLLYNDHLLNPNINTVVVDGFFGTGKTSTVSSHMIQGIINHLNDQGDLRIPDVYLSKPHVPLGATYGHLPGELEDKTELEFQSYFQYFDRYAQPGFKDYLMGTPSTTSQAKIARFKYQHLEEPILHVMVFEYLRGRDIEEGWVVLDEAQNTDRKEMSSLVSRVGDGAKLILLGDTSPTQIDRKKLDSHNNGLAFMKDVYVGKKYTGYVSLQTEKHILRGQRVRDLFRALKTD